MRRIVLPSIVMSVTALTASAQQRDAPAAHEPVVVELTALLETRPDLDDALTSAIDASLVTPLSGLTDALHSFGPASTRSVFLALPIRRTT
jgi:hypothetical protein